MSEALRTCRGCALSFHPMDQSREKHVNDSQDSKRRDQEKAGAPAAQLLYRLETDPEFREQMAQAAKRIASGIQQMHSQLVEMAARVTSGVEEFQRKLTLMAGGVEPVLSCLIDSFNRLPEALRRALTSLAQESWFISPDMSLAEPSDAAVLFMKGEQEAGNQHLAQYFENKLDEIERTLIETLPRRAALISLALAAHRRGEYALAIPLLLAQTDGVCLDLADGHLFQSERAKRKGVRARPETAAFVDKIENDVFWAALLSPLGQKIPINFSSSERGEGFEGLNRHLVMHGESLDYGTATNSLKCISLLSYAAWVLNVARARTPERLPVGPRCS